MSIVADIHMAKARYFEHLAVHKCRDAISSRADGQEPCETRADLLTEWTNTAGNWGLAADDDNRQREHFLRNEKKAALQ